MRTALFVICLVAALPAQEHRMLCDFWRTRLVSIRISSYESSAIARRPLGGGLIDQVRLKFAYASAKMTPPNLPVPMLPQVINLGRLTFSTSKGTRWHSTSIRSLDPVPHFTLMRLPGELPARKSWRLRPCTRICARSLRYSMRARGEIRRATQCSTGSTRRAMSVLPLQPRTIGSQC